MNFSYTAFNNFIYTRVVNLCSPRHTKIGMEFFLGKLTLKVEIRQLCVLEQMPMLTKCYIWPYADQSSNEKTLMRCALQFTVFLTRVKVLQHERLNDK